MRLSLPALMLCGGLSLCGCANENEVREIRVHDVAVVTGDYDHMEAALLRQFINHQAYDGFIVGATWDAGGTSSTENVLQVESLLGSLEEMTSFGAVFLNSGARGMGLHVYNGVESDDSLVSDSQVLENVRDFVEGGGRLVASDWTYDLLEACWPDALEFAGDDSILDDAQRGAMGTVSARVVDEGLEEDLGSPSVSIRYDFSHWATLLSVADHVDVHLEGDVTWRESDATGDVVTESAPLLVSFEVGRGQVVYSTFHWRAQNSEVADALLLSVVKGLYRGRQEQPYE